MLIIQNCYIASTYECSFGILISPFCFSNYLKNGVDWNNGIHIISVIFLIFISTEESIFISRYYYRTIVSNDVVDIDATLSAISITDFFVDFTTFLITCLFLAFFRYNTKATLITFLFVLLFNKLFNIFLYNCYYYICKCDFCSFFVFSVGLPFAYTQRVSKIFSTFKNIVA